MMPIPSLVSKPGWPNYSNVILLFDTSTPTGFLLVGGGARVLASATWQAEQSHSQKLIPQVRIALEMAGITESSLTHIAVGAGPGSFTGLRVALATAKGLAISLGLPIVAIPSLELFAAGVDVETGTIASTSDAFRGELYLGIYEKSGPALSLVGEIRSVTPERAIESIKELGKPAVMTGTGYQRYQPLFDAAFLPLPLGEGRLSAGILAEGEGEAHLTGLLHLAEHYVQEGRITDPAAVLPFYVREAEAVEKLKK